MFARKSIWMDQFTSHEMLFEWWPLTMALTHNGHHSNRENKFNFKQQRRKKKTNAIFHLINASAVCTKTQIDVHSLNSSNLNGTSNCVHGAAINLSFEIRENLAFRINFIRFRSFQTAQTFSFTIPMNATHFVITLPHRSLFTCMHFVFGAS